MINYLRQVRAELKHVTWPSRQQTIMYTVVVIGVSLIVAAYLGVLDYFFAAIVQRVI